MGGMRCPMCGGDNGDAASVARRGYHCIACDKWPNSTWWHREEDRRLADDALIEVELPDALDRLRVGAPIARDELADHFDAVSLDTGLPVVLRMYRWSRPDSAEAMAWFRALVARHARIAHAAILSIVAAGVHDGRFYVATEAPEGRALAAMLGEPWPWQRATHVIAQLASACGAAHAEGLIPSPEPADVFVAWRAQVVGDGPYRGAALAEEPRVSMYGLGRAIRRIPQPAREVGEHRGITGSPAALAYLSPEQLMGKPLDGRSDVYTLGVLAYELVTGRRPFHDAKGPAGLITAQLKRRPEPPSQLAPDLPAAVNTAILRCLEKDRNLRVQEAGDLAAALRELS